jgi:hypothetical protein
MGTDDAGSLRNGAFTTNFGYQLNSEGNVNGLPSSQHLVGSEQYILSEHFGYPN